MITIYKTTVGNVDDTITRTAHIVVSDENEAFFWIVGGLPETGDLQEILNSRETVIFRQASESAMSVDPVVAHTQANDYLQGQIDKDDLLADIAGQLEVFPGLITNIDTALAAVPNLAIPTGAKTIFTLILQNQKRVLHIEERELRAWRFIIKNIRIE